MATANSGYSPDTKTFSSTRPRGHPAPPNSIPISFTSYAFSLLPNPLPPNPSFLSFPSSSAVSFSSLIARTSSLSRALSFIPYGAVAFIVASPAHNISLPPLVLSLLSLGVVVSPSNPASTEQEILHQTTLSKPVIAFVTSDVAHKIPSDVVPRVVVIDSAEFRSLLHAEHAAEAGSGTASTFSPLRKVEQSDTAAVLYSSGTTGRVKGVVLTHRNFISLLAGQRTMRNSVVAAMAEPPGPTVALFTVPLFHVFGFMMMLRSVGLMDTAVFMEGGFKLGSVLEAVERHKVTIIPAAPPVLIALLRSEESRRWDISSLQALAIGGAPVRRELAEAFTARFPNVQIVQGYGLTESTGSVAVTWGPEETQVLGSVGRLSPGLEAKIMDPNTGEVLEPGHRGELFVRGPLIMKGYLGNDQATASTITPDGWLKTGDLCYFNKDGFLFVVDRLKELIKYKGYQVPPAEIEQILHSHPQIVEAAVIPYPDDETGQIPMAFVVRQPGAVSLTEDQVKEFVAKQVAPYKKIRRVAFINEIPKSPAGKVLRRVLIDHALSLAHRSSKL